MSDAKVREETIYWLPRLQARAYAIDIEPKRYPDLYFPLVAASALESANARISSLEKELSIMDENLIARSERIAELERENFDLRIRLETNKDLKPEILLVDNSFTKAIEALKTGGEK